MANALSDAPNMNEQGNCHPIGCPDGYTMLDDDETGTCYTDNNVIVCEGSNAKFLTEDCAIYEPVDDQPTCEEGFLLENGACEPLTSNCGGEPARPHRRKTQLLVTLFPEPQNQNRTRTRKAKKQYQR